MIVVGGLGRGGDVGGGLVIGLHLMRLGVKPIVASFLRCKTGSIVNGENITEALVRVTPRSYSSGRFFEPHVSGLGFETYVLCVEERKEDVVKGIEWLVRKRRVRVWFATDLGGDSLVKGDEPLVGSYKTDMRALAALSEAIEKYGLKGFLAVGVLGLEGGGKELSQAHLANHVMELYMDGAYRGYYVPPKNLVSSIMNMLSYLLGRQRSAMLTLYRDTLGGFVGRRRYDVVYLHDIVEIKPWHKVLFIFDAGMTCERSIFCRKAREGWSHGLRRAARNRKIKRLKKGEAPKLDSVVEILMRRPFHLERIVKELIPT